MEWRARFGVQQRTRRGPSGWAVVVAVAAIALFIYPVVLLFLGAFRTAPPGRGGNWSAGPITDAFSSSETFTAFGNSIFYAATKEVLVLAIAILLALVATRVKHPMAKCITPMAIVVFAMPGLFFAISWDMLGNPKIGLINNWINSIPAIGRSLPKINVESWHGIIGVTALKSIAIEYLLLLGPFSAMDRQYEEASIMSGATPLRTVLRVNLPLMLPTISAVAIVGIGQVMGTLDVPLVIGLPANIQMFSTRIYEYINASYPADYGQASGLSMVLVAIVLSLVVIQRVILRGRNYQTVTGKSMRRERWAVSRTMSLLIYLVVIGYALLALALPLFQLVLSSFEPFIGSTSNLSSKNYQQLFNDGEVFVAIRNSLLVSIAGGFAAMVLAVVFSYGRARRTKVGHFVSVATWVPYAVPGVVLSLAILWAVIPVPGFQLLYGTIWIVMIALVINTVPLTSRIAENALEQISVSLEEAALISGASRLRAVSGILIRLIMPSFLIGWLVALIMIIGNLDVPLLISGVGNQTIAVMVFGLYTTGKATRAAALFCILIGLIVVAFVAILIAQRLLFRRSIQGRRLLGVQ